MLVQSMLRGCHLFWRDAISSMRMSYNDISMRMSLPCDVIKWDLVWGGCHLFYEQFFVHKILCARPAMRTFFAVWAVAWDLPQLDLLASAHRILCALAGPSKWGDFEGTVEWKPRSGASSRVQQVHIEFYVHLLEGLVLGDLYASAHSRRFA